jgi:hypothetical protein
MATNGTITPSANAADVTNLTFNPGFNYTTGCDGAPDPQGCASNPFVVNATLVVAAGTPANTTGTLSVSNTGSNGLNADGTPASGFVKVKAASNQNPTVKTEAADANGTEGDTLTTSGAFEDLDGDPLTLSADNGTVGTFTPGASGTWTWSLPTSDDVPGGTITVTANDGKGGTVSDSFTYSAVNADPSIDSLGLTGTNCDPVLGFDVSDPGTADTHEGIVDWDDASADTAFTNADLPFSQSHHYGSAGSYTIRVDVEDDDLGTDSDSTLTHTVSNIPSNVLQPINYTGRPTNPLDMSLFKAGSTVPVKITVADCDGNSVGTLSPTVAVNKYDNSADGYSVESTSPANPTPGTVMRYDATAVQYIYNLGTKGFTNGDYKITISDPSFASVIAYISLKGK